jgi:hypothetical protein
MQTTDFLASTDETVQFTPRYEHRSKHSQTRSFFKHKRFQIQKTRNLSKPTDSTSTLIENTKISQSLNTQNLKLSLKYIYDQDPTEQLKQIFKSKYPVSPQIHSKQGSKNFGGEMSRRRRSKVDSIFQQSEAELIMDELKTIKNPDIWEKVVQKFKQRPSTLMDLVPLE